MELGCAVALIVISLVGIVVVRAGIKYTEG